MFLNMEKFNSIGFFDDNFFLYFEEIDLCRRIKNNSEKNLSRSHNKSFS